MFLIAKYQKSIDRGKYINKLFFTKLSKPVDYKILDSDKPDINVVTSENFIHLWQSK